MNILALDLGTKTGWALKKARSSVSGEQAFTPQRFEGGGMRYLRFERWLNELALDGIDLVAFEEVRNHAGVTAAHTYGGFLATLMKWCEGYKVPYIGVPVGTIKKHATGRGNASKLEMIAAMRLKGHTLLVKSDNEADALAIMYWAIEEHDHKPKSRERRAFKR